MRPGALLYAGHMAEVLFKDERDGAELPPAQSGSERAVKEVLSWAEANHFAQVVFWRDGADQGRFWVQLDDQRLNYWVPASTLQDGGHEQIEMQLDYARGAQRRSAAGYDKFDK